MTKKQNKESFRIYSKYDSASRKRSLEGAIFLAFFSIIFFSILVGIACANLVDLKDDTSKYWLITVIFPLLFGIPSIDEFFSCFFDRFRLKDGRYEVRAFLHKKVSCRKEDAVSFGQGSSGSVGLFAKDGSLLLLVPLRKNWNNKEELLLRVRHVLIHQGLKEISLEEADRLLPAQKKK